MYKFGFYIYLHKHLVLGFDGKCFRFFFIDRELIPNKILYSTGQYDKLRIPVLFNANGNTITKILFFRDFNVEGIKSRTNLYPHIKIKVGETIDLNDLIIGTVSIFDKHHLNKKEIELGKLLIESHISEQYMSELSPKINYISSSDIWKPRKWKSVINDYKEYIDTIDIKQLVDSLYVKVWDFQKTKIGGDDTYYVYREAKLLDGTTITDPYLIEIIGLGKNCIEKDGGYTSHFERPNIPFGVYENDILAAEKLRIVNNYSKEEHMGWLFYDQLFKQEKLKNELNEWNDRRLHSISELDKHYSYNDLDSLDQRLFYEFDSRSTDHNIILGRINRLIKFMQDGVPQKRIIITGTFPIMDELKWKNKIDTVISYLSENERIAIISGKAKGAESTAMSYALDNQIELICDYNNWTLCGRDQSKERANSMIETCDILIVTEAKSILSKNLIEAAKTKGIPVKVIK